jgi:hypothetical protein
LVTDEKYGIYNIGGALFVLFLYIFAKNGKEKKKKKKYMKDE